MIKVVNGEAFISDDTKIRVNGKLYTVYEICETMKDYDKFDRKTLIRNINKYGATAQEDVCIEEVSELTQAILKLRRAVKSGEYNISDCMSNLIEEIADVEICIEYLKLIHGITTPDIRNRIDKMIEYKVERIKTRMEAQN